MADFAPRRADPGTEFAWADGDGNHRTLRADKKGVVRPTDGESEAILNGFNLPVARKAIAEEKAAEETAPEVVTDTAGPGNPDAETKE